MRELKEEVIETLGLRTRFTAITVTMDSVLGEGRGIKIIEDSLKERGIPYKIEPLRNSTYIIAIDHWNLLDYYCSIKPSHGATYGLMMLQEESGQKVYLLNWHPDRNLFRSYEPHEYEEQFIRERRGSK
jgi:hypothetical protein